ncbi:uncharacterized protein LTR77_010838 [Saxophila tyrrhenica]|uniref:Cutinase n=1 Tax=Saxophila tyrrhenica TaxID=1690608 RepID=A0AAV9NU99_9PEZI|nr:hypothetical protein LTR77_010838 [Saxophila tyrrhenica]
MPSLLTSSLLFTSLWTVATTAQDSCAVCDDVHFFLARGNNEPYPGRQSALVEATCNGLSSCGYEDLIFADLASDLYCQITYDATIAGHVQMTAYAQKCPDSKLILAGYSIGGQAASDVLGGAGGELANGCIQPEIPALDFNSSPANQIAAVIIFGDVRHTANQSYNFGSGASFDGLFPRTQEMLNNLDQYADIMRSWCADTDPICAADGLEADIESHLNYYDLYSEAAASWIKSVASLTDDSDSTTNIPVSISGTVQDQTAGTATPSGSVTLSTEWTNTISYAPCTTTAHSQHVSSMAPSAAWNATSPYGNGTNFTITVPSTATNAAVTKARFAPSASARLIPSVNGGSMVTVGYGLALTMLAMIIV